MQRILICAALIAAFSANPCAQTRLYVNGALGTSGDGSTWAKAYKDLGSALKAAKLGTEIWVAKGTYKGGFVIPNGVSLFGGLASGDTRLTQRDVGDKATILDGEDKNRVLSMGQASLVDGFFIQRGRAGSPGGGGVLVLGATVTIRKCAFLNNNLSAGRGSAAFFGKDTNGRGANPLLENSLFVGNGKGTSRGHVIDFEGSSGTVLNIGVDNNYDNGLHMFGSSSTKIYNSYFTNNSGRGICHIDAGTKPILENNLFYKNSRGHYHYRGSDYSKISQVNALSYAKNNIEGDPLFTDASKLDYSLKSTSPLIDAGQDISGAANQDVDGNCRRLDGDSNGIAQTDIGPIEYSNVYLGYTGTASPGNNISIESDGKDGTFMIMAVGDGIAPSPVYLGELGYLFVDFSKTAVIISWPVVGKNVPVGIPKSFPKGISVVFQASAGTSTWGNLSNPLDILVR